MIGSPASKYSCSRPRWARRSARLGDAFLRNPKQIAVSRPASVATTIVEGLVLVAEHDKRESLRRLIRTQKVQNALIFCNRKSEVDILHRSLLRHKFDVGALHGDMAQTVRFATLEKFKANELRCWCAATSRRAAWTSAACRTCSISTCRTTPRTMSTASAAPAAPGWRATPSPSPRRRTGSPSRRSRNWSATPSRR